MSTTPLTLAEAVPLGTVYLQRLLAAAEIRSLVIKGPAFVELGVRKPKQSHDIDILIHPSDRKRVRDVLGNADWRAVSLAFPTDTERFANSITYAHARFTSTVDVHHYFPGVLGGEDAFEVMWSSRTKVVVAHQPLTTLRRDHALVIEGLNSLKGTRPSGWERRVEAIRDGADAIDPESVLDAARSIGARHTASALITALGGSGPSAPVGWAYWEWRMTAGRGWTYRMVIHTLSAAPWRLPWVAWWLLFLDSSTARTWAVENNVPYRNRLQIMTCRLRRAWGH